MNHQLQYAHTAWPQVILVFASWTVGLWLLGAGLAWLRLRYRVPGLARG
ncbi:hypothetical protein [Lacticaseibacillus kribbianus]|nr:hypothetical protein [Lacticaseibacillus kribbianus]